MNSAMNVMNQWCMQIRSSLESRSRDHMSLRWRHEVEKNTTDEELSEGFQQRQKYQCMNPHAASFKKMLMENNSKRPSLLA